MAPIIRILLTLSCALLGECRLEQLVRQLLGLAPSVGRLLPQQTTLDILHSLYHDEQNHLYPYGLKVHSYNINSNRNYNPVWSSFEKGSSSSLGLKEYPEYKIDDKTPVDDVAFLNTGESEPETGDISNADNVPRRFNRIKGTQEALPPKTNTIKRIDDRPENAATSEDFIPGQDFRLVRPNNNGNNMYLLQEIGNTNTPNTINLPTGANQPTNNVLFATSNPTQNNQLYAIINGQLVPTLTAQVNQNTPYFSSQLNSPAVNQNPSYVLVYANPVSIKGQNGNAGQANAASVPVTSKNPGTNSVYIVTPNPGHYLFKGPVPNVIATPNTVTPQTGIQVGNGNIESLNNNPNCCQNNVPKINIEDNITKETAVGNDTDATNKEGELPRHRPLLMTANGLTLHNIQPAPMMSYKETTVKDKSKE